MSNCKEQEKELIQRVSVMISKFDKICCKKYNLSMKRPDLSYFTENGAEPELLEKIDWKNIPEHVAITMDGNGRWAKSRGLDRVAGHKEGTVSARIITEACVRLGVKYLTLYTFSSENWKRPVREINALMDLLHKNLEEKIDLVMDNKIRLKVVGDITALPGKLIKKLQQAEKDTENFKNMQLNLALNYGSRMELINAVKGIVRDGISENKIKEKLFEKYLYTAGCPDPDLLIRTSGEQRISNFLLYQIAYSELYFTDIPWPDFRVRALVEAVVDFQNRKRRYGAI